MQIQLRWVDPTNGQEKTPRLETPVLFGSSLNAMPNTLDGEPASRMVLDHDQVELFHAVIEVVGGQLYINDRNSRHGTKVNRVARASHGLQAGDLIQIGPFEIRVSLPSANAPASTPPPLPNVPISADATETVKGSVGGFVAPINAMGQAGSAGSLTSDEPVGGMGPGGTCNTKVGFLIKRRCGRTTTAGCKFCRNGQVDPGRDLYADDYSLYPSYGNYGRSYWGSRYYYNRDRYYYDSTNRRVDFTEADGASFDNESDQDYEMDLDAS